MVNKDRHTPGERSATSKLTRKDVIDIRRLRKDGAKISRIAYDYNISPTHVCDICNGVRWKHVDDYLE